MRRGNVLNVSVRERHAVHRVHRLLGGRLFVCWLDGVRPLRHGHVPGGQALVKLRCVPGGALQLEHGIVVEQQLPALRGGQLPGVDRGRELHELSAGELLRGALPYSGCDVCSWALRPVDDVDKLRELPPGQVLLFDGGDQL